MPDSPQTESLYQDARGDISSVADLESDGWELSDNVDDSVQALSTTGINVGGKWEAIGPFPSGTREHTFLASPLAAFPETSTDRKFALLPYDTNSTWPSELVDGGQVGWKTFETSCDGWVNVSYPEIRWKQLRDAHGWAALQHQVVLRTNFTLHPRDNDSADEARPVLLELISGTEWTLVRKNVDDEESTTWYNGDVYAYASEQGPVTQASIFAHRIDLIPGDYVLLLRVNFELRLAGDPGSEPPNIRFKFNAAADALREQARSTTFQVLPELHSKPDMVDGLFMGRHFGIALRKVSPMGAEDEDWFLDEVKIQGKYLSFRGYDDFAITSGGLVVVPLHAVQRKPVTGCPIALNLTLVMRSSSRDTVDVPIRIEITHHHFQKCSSFRFTFTTAPCGDDHFKFSPALVSHAVAVPPTDASLPPVATILALHGAGVDATSQAWIDAIPRRANGWAVLPTGRTSWGEDWHGGSMQDAWAARDALKPILDANRGSVWSSESVGEGTTLMGHSNGGQGAWHLAGHWPDRVVGMVAAAGYSKIQDYVPYSSWSSNHYADPALMGILNCSLSPYSNDLYLPNLRDIPVLAIHGADDHNVPPQHSRLQVGLVQSHQGSRDTATLVEVPGEDHWWSEVLKLPQVLDFLENLPLVKPELSVDGTTLVTYNPSETGSKNGFRIIRQGIPGQCSKLSVSKSSGAKLLQAGIDHVLTLINTTVLSYIGPELGIVAINGDIVDSRGKLPCSFVLQDSWLCVPHSACDQEHTTRFSSVTVPASTGPMLEVLASRHAMRIVINHQDKHHRSAALRLQHDLFVFHRIQAQITSATAAIALRDQQALGPGSLICFGSCLRRTNVVDCDNGEAGWISRYPHPSSATSAALAVGGVDVKSFERALRLFPIRTGVPVPHWVRVGPDMDWQGAGGFLGAGYLELGPPTSRDSFMAASWGGQPPL